MLINNKFNMRLLQADGGDGNGANGGNADATDPKADNNEPKKTFTQEELNDIVSKRLAKETKKHNEELEALREEYESNINSKVEDKLSEAEKLAKMSASEKKEYELNKRLQELEAKEKEYSIKELKNTSRELLGELGYSKEEVKALELSDDDKEAIYKEAKVETQGARGIRKAVQKQLAKIYHDAKLKEEKE